MTLSVDAELLANTEGAVVGERELVKGKNKALRL
jgi:hypothetical protein